MELTLVRAERTKAQNQERAYIAAARRTDRPFEHRLASLRKASQLHEERTGRGFRISSDQLEDRGPLKEKGNDDRRAAILRRFRPYPTPWDFAGQSSPEVMFKPEGGDYFSPPAKDHQMGIDSYRHGFSPYPTGDWMSQSTQFGEETEEVAKESLSPIKEEHSEHLGITSSQSGRASAFGPSQTDTQGSHTSLPPSFFELNEHEAQSQMLPKMSGQDVQKFINEFLLQPSSGLSVHWEDQLGKSGTGHLEEEIHFAGTSLEAEIEGEGDGVLGLASNYEEWASMVNDDDDDIISQTSQLSLLEETLEDNGDAEEEDRGCKMRDKESESTLNSDTEEVK